LLGLLRLAHAQDVRFEGFTGVRTVPDADVEEAGVWTESNVSADRNIFDVVDGVLKQTSDECRLTTKTLLPVVDGTDWREVLSGNTPPLLGEVIDSTNSQSAAGIYTASNPTRFTDIVVFGLAFAVELEGKLPTFWGDLTVSHY
jgi:hypothetical protein